MTREGRPVPLYGRVLDEVRGDNLCQVWRFKTCVSEVRPKVSNVSGEGTDSKSLARLDDKRIENKTPYRFPTDDTVDDLPPPSSNVQCHVTGDRVYGPGRTKSGLNCRSSLLPSRYLGSENKRGNRVHVYNPYSY